LLAYVCAETATDGQWLQGLEEFTGEDGRSLTERLTIEITETAAISDFAETVKFVRALKALGRSVALDDFGAGYTSYRSLRTFGLAMVNIDGSFIQNLGTEAEDERLVRTLIELARSFGVSTVGERVGDEETARILENAGIAYMQGYFFGAPELAALLRAGRPTGAAIGQDKPSLPLPPCDLRVPQGLTSGGRAARAAPAWP